MKEPIANNTYPANLSDRWGPGAIDPSTIYYLKMFREERHTNIQSNLINTVGLLQKTALEKDYTANS